MSPEAEKVKQILDRICIDRDTLNQVVKDRLDFGFDSIYFRFAEVCDELAAYKALFNGTNAVEERRRMDGRKMHFYQALEQLVHAHDPEVQK